MSSDRGIGLSGGGARPQAVSPAAGTVDRLIQELPSLSPTERRELASLAGERDAELFWADLLRLGTKLESRDKLEAAVSIYGLASRQAPEGLQAKAQARLDAVEGRGAVGARVEFHLRRFSRDAFDYKMILPMMAGSAVYNLAKGAALGRFAAVARPIWWMRGAPGRLSAASLGYFAEVPAFALSSRFLHGLDSKAPAPSLGHELSSAAITLALLKGGGSLTSSGLSRVLGARGAPGLRFAAGQVAMFGGLWSAHRIEEKIGLRQAHDGDTAATDILASMLSLGIGAQLGKRWLGEAHARRQAEFDWRVQSRGATLNLARPLSDKLALEALGPTVLQMSSDGGENPPADRPKQVRTSSAEFRFRQTLRNLKSSSKKWAAIADLVETMAFDIRNDERYSTAGKSWMLNSLEYGLRKFGVEQSDFEKVWIALTQLAQVRSLKLSEDDYNRRIHELETHGRLPPELPPKSVSPSHDLSLTTLDLVTDRLQVWEDMARDFRQAYERIDPSQQDGEAIRDRLVDMVDRVIELLKQSTGFTPPLAMRWLRAFERAARGEMSWNEFEAIDPLRFRVEAAELPPKAEAPERSPGSLPLPTPAPLPAKLSSYSELVLVDKASSALRLFTVPSSSSSGAKEFGVRLILPNLDQLQWKTQVDAEGEMSLLEGGKGKHLLPNRREASPLQVEKIEGFLGRFKLIFGGKELVLDLQGEKDRGDNFTRLKFNSQFPASPTPFAEHFSPWQPRLDHVKVEHAETVSWSTLRAESGVQWRDVLYLSNGDTVELIGLANFKKGTDVEVKQAWLHRFGDPSENARAMEVAVSAARAGAYKILLKEASGYRLNLEVKFPKMQERGRHQWNRLRVEEAPAPMHLRWGEEAAVERGLADSTDSDASIRGMAADALFGDLKAIEGLGGEGRSQDTAIWELKDLFEMTWEDGDTFADFGGKVELVRIREKIGDALRDSARQNPLAKKILIELENKYGAASLIEEAPALPSLPPTVPSPEPKPIPIAQPKPIPTAPKVAVTTAAVSSPKPSPKPVLTPSDKVDRRLTQAVNGPLKKVINNLILELPPLLQALSASELRDLFRKHIQLMEEASRSGNLQQIMTSMCVADTAILFLPPEHRPEAIDDLARSTTTLIPTQELAGALMGLVRAKTSAGGRRVFARFLSVFDSQAGDTPAIAELRKTLFGLAKDIHKIRSHVPEIYRRSRDLSPQDATIFRDQLWNTLQLVYMDYVVTVRNTSLADALMTNTAILTALFSSMLGATANMESAPRLAYLEKVGIEQQGKFHRFQPFPNQPFDVLQMEIPLLTPQLPTTAGKKGF